MLLQRLDQDLEGQSLRADLVGALCDHLAQVLDARASIHGFEVRSESCLRRWFPCPELFR